MSHDWTNTDVAVLGFGVSGRAAADFLSRRGARVLVIDRDPDKVQSPYPVVGENVPLDFSIYRYLVVSPGVPRQHPLYRQAQEAGVAVFGEAELALQSTDQIVLGITGTNGKTTVTELVTHILPDAMAVGNIGAPLTTEVDRCKTRVLVAELSSYQIETLQSRKLHAAVILNITPDHLDRYGDMNEYAQAKIDIGKCVKPGGKLFVFEEAYRSYAQLFGDAIQPICYGFNSDLPLYFDGSHLVYKEKLEFLLPLEYRKIFRKEGDNLLAAYALCHEIGVTPEEFLAGLQTFRKPPHRLEFVRNLKDVAYYNDSKGTNIEAVVRAVKAMQGETILIAGGVDKGSAYAPWIKAFAGKVKCICAIGEAKEKIQRELSKMIPVEICESLEEAIDRARSHAVAGDQVLLSPGCSSFEMFRDYAHRGEEFKQIVKAL